jgi:hypothetical protein
MVVFTLPYECDDLTRNQNVTCSNTISGCMKNDMIVEVSHMSSIKVRINVNGEERKNHINGILEKK